MFHKDFIFVFSCVLLLFVKCVVCRKFCLMLFVVVVCPHFCVFLQARFVCYFFFAASTAAKARMAENFKDVETTSDLDWEDTCFLPVVNQTNPRLCVVYLKKTKR